MRPVLGLNLGLFSRSSRFLTGTQEKHVMKSILNDYLLMITGERTVLRDDKTVGTLLLTSGSSNSWGWNSSLDKHSSTVEFDRQMHPVGMNYSKDSIDHFLRSDTFTNTFLAFDPFMARLQWNRRLESMWTAWRWSTRESVSFQWREHLHHSSILRSLGQKVQRVFFY